MRTKEILLGVLLLGLTTVVSGCNLEMSNKTQVGQYNDTALSRIEGYAEVAEVNYKLREERYAELVTNEVKFTKQYDLEVKDLDKDFIDEFNTYSILRHDYFTSIENENVREIIVLNGVRSKIYVNMIWDMDGKLIYIDRKVVTNG